MDAFFSLLFGGSMKVYDDLTDNNILTGDLQLQVLKTIQVVSLTAISLRDFGFSVFFLLINLAALFADPKAYIADNFYVSIMAAYPLLLLSSFPFRESLNSISILYIFSFVAYFAVEPYITPEEYSYKKFILRVISTILTGAGLVFAKRLDISPSFIKIGIACFAYIFVSSIFQFYMLQNEKETSPVVHA